jgi:hypothetical protein
VPTVNPELGVHLFTAHSKGKKTFLAIVDSGPRPVINSLQPVARPQLNQERRIDCTGGSLTVLIHGAFRIALTTVWGMEWFESQLQRELLNASPNLLMRSASIVRISKLRSVINGNPNSAIGGQGRDETK